MKRSITLLLYLLFMLTLTVSCKKEIVKAEEAIEGVWVLRKTSGSWTTVTYQPGSGNDISFTGTIYQMRETGQIVESGEYEIVA